VEVMGKIVHCIQLDHTGKKYPNFIEIGQRLVFTDRRTLDGQ